MSVLFSKPKAPPEAPPPPTVNEAAMAQDQSDRLRKRRGRSSTILVPDSMGGSPTGAKALLGQ